MSLTLSIVLKANNGKYVGRFSGTGHENRLQASSIDIEKYCQLTVSLNSDNSYSFLGSNNDYLEYRGGTKEFYWTGNASNKSKFVVSVVDSPPKGVIQIKLGDNFLMVENEIIKVTKNNSAEETKFTVAQTVVAGEEYNN